MLLTLPWQLCSGLLSSAILTTSCCRTLVHDPAHTRSCMRHCTGYTCARQYVQHYSWIGSAAAHLYMLLNKLELCHPTTDSRMQSYCIRPQTVQWQIVSAMHQPWWAYMPCTTATQCQVLHWLSPHDHHSMHIPQSRLLHAASSDSVPERQSPTHSFGLGKQQFAMQSHL